MNSASEQLVGITLAGIFDRVGSAWREPVNAPNGGFTSVSLGGAELSALGGRVTRHRQTLRFANALFERETSFASKGTSLTVRSARFLSAETPNLGVIRFSITCSRSAAVTIRTGIDGNIWDLNGPHLLGLESKRQDSVLIVEGRTNESAKRVAVAEAADIGFGKVTYESSANRSLRVVRFRAEAGKTYTFHKYFAVFTDNDAVRGPGGGGRGRGRPAGEGARLRGLPCRPRRQVEGEMGSGATSRSRATTRRSSRSATASSSC